MLRRILRTSGLSQEKPWRIRSGGWGQGGVWARTLASAGGSPPLLPGALRPPGLGTRLYLQLSSWSRRHPQRAPVLECSSSFWLPESHSTPQALEALGPPEAFSTRALSPSVTWPPRVKASPAGGRWLRHLVQAELGVGGQEAKTPRPAPTRAGSSPGSACHPLSTYYVPGSLL